MRASNAVKRSGQWENSDSLTAIGSPGSNLFRARGADENRCVAVRLWFGASGDETVAARERVNRASRVSNPMLARIEACQERGNAALWIVSEYVPGPTLEAWAKTGRMLPVASAIDLVRRLSLGVQAALKQGISHHAIQPRNLVVWRQSAGRELRLDAKLVDLAVSAWMDPEPPRLRSAHFMAPESLARVLADRDPSDTIDARANVYSCGALLYYLACGALPFDSGSLPQLAAAQAEGRLVSPRSHNPRISYALERVILGALSAPASGRYANPGELASVLAAVELLEQNARLARTAAAEPGGEPSAVTLPAIALAAAKSAQPRLPRERLASELVATGERSLPNVTSTRSRIDLDDAARSWSVPADRQRLSMPDETTLARLRPSQFWTWSWLPVVALGAMVSGYWASDAASLSRSHSLTHAKLAAATVRPDAALQQSTLRRAAPKPSVAAAGPGAALFDSADGAKNTPPMAASLAESRRIKPHQPAAEPSPSAEPSPPQSDAAESSSSAQVPVIVFKPIAAVSSSPTPAPPVELVKPPVVRAPRSGTAEARITRLSIRGSLADSVVRRAMERVRPQWTECYTRSNTAADQVQLGALHLDLTIDEVGRAREPRVSGAKLPELAACVTRGAARLSAEAPDTGTVDVSCDLHFAP